MFITANDLREHKACEQGIRYFERFYPNGAELIDIIRDRHINKEFLHWGRQHLTTTQEEMDAYCEVCNIVNTNYFWCSQNVLNSYFIVRSKDVTESRSIFESVEVNNSSDVVGGDNVNQSKQIFYSSMIEDCVRVLKSQNVVASYNICNSTMVARSKSVLNSFNVFDSTEIIDCDTVTESHFCQKCKNIDHCLFCDGIENAEYHIFNKPVSKSHYDLIASQYMKYLVEELDFVREWPKELSRSISIYATRKFDDWYHPIQPKFWKWARTLPGFDGMFLYNFTMLPELLYQTT